MAVSRLDVCCHPLPLKLLTLMLAARQLGGNGRADGPGTIWNYSL